MHGTPIFSIQQQAGQKHHLQWYGQDRFFCGVQPPKYFIMFEQFQVLDDSWFDLVPVDHCCKVCLRAFEGGTQGFSISSGTEVSTERT